MAQRESECVCIREREGCVCVCVRLKDRQEETYLHFCNWYSLLSLCESKFWQKDKNGEISSKKSYAFRGRIFTHAGYKLVPSMTKNTSFGLDDSFPSINLLTVRTLKFTQNRMYRVNKVLNNLFDIL